MKHIFKVSFIICLCMQCKKKPTGPNYIPMHIYGQCISLNDGRPIPFCRIEVLEDDNLGSSYRRGWDRILEIHYCDSAGKFDFNTKYDDDKAHAVYFMLDSVQRKYYCQFNDVWDGAWYNNKPLIHRFYPFKWSKVRFVNTNKYQTNDTIYIWNNCQTDGSDYEYPFWSNVKAHAACFLIGKNKDTTIYYRGQYDDPTFLQFYKVKNGQVGQIIYQPFADSRAYDTISYQFDY